MRPDHQFRVDDTFAPPRQPSLRSIFATGSSHLLVANLTVNALGVLTSILTCRLLGPAQRGEVAVITYWPLFFECIVNIALLEAVSVRVSRDPQAAGAHIRDGLLVAAGISALAVVVGFFTIPMLLQRPQFHLLTDARVYLLYLPAALVSSALIGGLLGQQRFAELAGIRVAATSSYLVAIIVLYFTVGATPRTMAAAMLATVMLQIPLAGLLLLASRRARAAGRGPDCSRRGAWSTAAIGTKLHSARIVSLLASVEDRAIANRTMSATSIGSYQIPVNISNVLLSIPNAFSQVLFSRLPGAMDSERKRLAVAHYARALLLTAGLVLLVAPAFPVLVPLLYGRDFQAAVAPAVIIAVAGIPAGATTVLQAIARAQTRVSICIQAEAGAMLVLGVLALLFAPRLELNGLALAYLAGRLFSWCWMLYRLPATIGLTNRAFLPWSQPFRASLRGDLALLASALSGRGRGPSVHGQAP
jgi:O-antigen/teichoic acid export membrane protein